MPQKRVELGTDAIRSVEGRLLTDELDAPWRSVAIWLPHGRPLSGILARLDRPALLRAAAGPGGIPALDKIMLSFLDGSEALGPAPALLTELAAQDGGPQAVSKLLSRRPGRDPLRGDESVARTGASTVALCAGSALEPAALTGAGRFAYADRLDDATWLNLTTRTVTLQPKPEVPYAVAERAARHPDSADTLLITAAMLSARWTSSTGGRSKDMRPGCSPRAPRRARPNMSNCGFR
ncbi:hypothetical protein ACN24M_00005 [Streptomyces microflavus]|uniref:hypothetical protein n=1 Tax=Streptomyces microflavus TaxID=1919 RepID=UPI003B20EDB7